MATTNQPTLSDEQLAELEKLARAQGRPVAEVLSEAVTAYLNERSWQNLVEAGHKRAKAMGLTEEDVPRLIAEVRSEQSR